MSNPLADYFRRRETLSDREAALLDGLTQRQELVTAGRELVAQGASPKQSCVILKGLAFRQAALRDGRRMISAVHVAGDFVDLHGFVLRELDHSVVAAVDTKVSWVPHAELARILGTEPHLARLFWMSTAIDGALSRVALTVVGRLPPVGKLAHLACELYLRLEAAGVASDHRFEFPATQVDLADIFGLSTVHLNRSLQALRATGALSWDGGIITINNWNRLVELGGFDGGYLNLHDRQAARRTA
jgi:CRP-like cAMP-binding protein